MLYNIGKVYTSTVPVPTQHAHNSGTVPYKFSEHYGTYGILSSVIDSV
jgi:hypothetical protein